MRQFTYWREAAAYWLDATRPQQDSALEPEHGIRAAYETIKTSGLEASSLGVKMHLIWAAQCAREEMENQGMWDERAMLDMLCERQAKYGPDNIVSTGWLGVVVRLVDKAERLKHLRLGRSRPDFADESYRDTLADIIGYFVVGIMAEKGQMSLPLQIQIPLDEPSV